jgi:DNA polymerase kappa
MENMNNFECNRIQINDSKAGMKNIDKEKINTVILRLSKNSKFFKKQQIKDQVIKRKGYEKMKKLILISKSQLDHTLKLTNDFITKCELKRDFSRYIVHIDMDAFFANVEIKDNPHLAYQPIAVGSDSMLSTSNYLARQFGVRAAMPGFIARELCPNLVILPSHYSRYQFESNLVMQLVSEYDANYSTASLDEAYLDLTENLKKRIISTDESRTYELSTDDSNNEKILFGKNVEECVMEIRHRFYLATKLTASA